MKVEQWQINQRRSLPLDAKIRMSMERIRSWYEHYDGDVFVSYSGGKDSTLLLHLVRTIYPEVPGVFCDTGLEYPEIRRFATDTENVTVVRPRMRFGEVIEKYGWPVISKRQAQYLSETRTCSTDSAIYRLRTTGIKSDGSYSRLSKISDKYLRLVQKVRSGELKISDRCCHVMKKAPLHQHMNSSGLYPYIGVMASEGRNRDLSWKMYGCNAHDLKSPASRPLMAWSEQDVLRYLVDNQIEIASVYGEIVETHEGLSTTGVNRTGCMFCLFGIHMESTPNRLQRMRKTHPRQYEFIIDRLGAGEILDILGVEYGEPMQMELFDD